MKTSFFTVLLLVYGITAFAQDNAKKPKGLFRPSIELGTSFYRNDILKDSLKTGSTLEWGVGLQFNHSIANSVIPFVMYNQSNYATKTPLDSTESFRSNLLRVGVLVPAYSSKKHFVQPIISFTIGKISNDFMPVSDFALGYNAGIRLEKQILLHSRVFMEFSYAYLKLNSSSFKDYDSFRFLIGFTL